MSGLNFSMVLCTSLSRLSWPPLLSLSSLDIRHIFSLPAPVTMTTSNPNILSSHDCSSLSTPSLPRSQSLKLRPTKLRSPCMSRFKSNSLKLTNVSLVPGSSMTSSLSSSNQSSSESVCQEVIRKNVDKLGHLADKASGSTPTSAGWSASPTRCWTTRSSPPKPT